MRWIRLTALCASRSACSRSVCASLLLTALCASRSVCVGCDGSVCVQRSLCMRSVCDGCGCGYLLRFYQPSNQPFKVNLRMSVGILRLIKSLKMVGLAGFILFLLIPSAHPHKTRRAFSDALHGAGRTLRSLWLRSLCLRSLCVRSLWNVL